MGRCSLCAIALPTPVALRDARVVTGRSVSAGLNQFKCAARQPVALRGVVRSDSLIAFLLRFRDNREARHRRRRITGEADELKQEAYRQAVALMN